MRWTVAALLFASACAAPMPTPTASAPRPGLVPVSARLPSGPDARPNSRPVALTAEALARSILVLDGHVDVPWRLEKSRRADGSLSEDITQATTGGDFDYPRARAGGLDAPFMSIYVSASFEGNGAKRVADGLIDMIEGIVADAPDKFALAPTAASVRDNFEAGKISLPMGMENGAPLEGELSNVAYFYGRGIRYITLTHSKDNHIADSSYDDAHTHGGLSPFGEAVVAEMNRVGIMIDVSHISDEAFDDVMRVSGAPVIASHSSCRTFTPGWERNMSDAMIQRLAAAGGVIQINFGSDFLDGKVSAGRKAHDAALAKHLAQQGLDPQSDAGAAAATRYAVEHPAPRATVQTVADHIDHVVGLVGVEYVGLGSDFDGVGDSLPEGLEDASKLPNLIAVLQARGYTRDAIEKIASGNVLRVWRSVEAHAARAAGQAPPTVDGS